MFCLGPLRLESGQGDEEAPRRLEAAPRDDVEAVHDVLLDEGEELLVVVAVERLQPLARRRHDRLVAWGLGILALDGHLLSRVERSVEIDALAVVNAHLERGKGTTREEDTERERERERESLF